MGRCGERIRGRSALAPMRHMKMLQQDVQLGRSRTHSLPNLSVV